MPWGAPSGIRCFVSYCHEGMDRTTLGWVVDTLGEYLGAGAEILIDVRMPTGGDLKAFMDMLDTVDVVLMVLTPQYRQHVLNREGGAYEEYTHILRRYENPARRGRRQRDRFTIIPILFSGDRGTSTPEEIATLWDLDLRGLRVQGRRGRYSLARSAATKYRASLRQLAAEIQAASFIVTKPFYRLRESYYDQLFLDLKADFDTPSAAEHRWLETIWVKTHAYMRIDSQLAYFIVGRKGSGKSAMTQVLPLLQAARYEVVIRITAENFDLEALYSLFSTRQFRSEVSTVVHRERAFELAWEAVIMLATIPELVRLADTANLSSLQRPLVNELQRFDTELKTLKKRSRGWQPSDYFSYAFDGLMRFLDSCIKDARDDDRFFKTDIKVLFSRDRYLEFVFGLPALEAFFGLIRSFRRRLLVTLDGFDEKFSDFRDVSIQSGDHDALRERGAFELDWLSALVSLATHAKASVSDPFYGALDFCVAAPRDRFLEVKHTQRDSYRTWQRWCALNWSGIELAILLRKRAEVLAGFESDRGLNPRLRLEQTLGRPPFNRLPQTIEFEYNGKQVSIPLFLYVLRHTFWRPREVLRYYASLLSLAEQMSRWGFPVTTDSVRETVARSTRLVVESEFLAELKTSVINIEEIVQSFRKAPIVLSLSDISDRLRGLPFRFATGELNEPDLHRKAQFLYDAGFLGLAATSQQKRELSLDCEHAFIFNEVQPGLFAEATLAEMATWDFMIHPVFTEFLHLDVSARDLLLNLNWDYLFRGDHRFAANPQLV